MALTVKSLKSKMDGNELDLSMSDLVPTALPVKELSVIPRATQLDLSVNSLTWLPDEFCSLTHLVRLDLSQNQLQDLPEKFGNISNLERLDLYKNCISTLPVSFCRLKKLKWLDLKDNPLTDDLRAATGDCLDDKQCHQAAQKVVSYMQKIQSAQERERQKKLQKQKEEEKERKTAEEARMAAQREAKNRERDRKKQDKQKKNNHPGKKEARFAERTGGEGKGRQLRQDKGQHGISMGSRVFGCCKFLLGVMLMLVGVVGCVTLGGAVVLYSNCSSRPEWIPGSKPLCHDLYQWSTTGASPSIHNLRLASQGLGVVAVDYGVWGSQISSGLRRAGNVLATTDYGKLVQDSAEWVSNTTGNVVVWGQKEAGPWLKETGQRGQVLAVWAWGETKTGLRTLESVQWMSVTVGAFLDRMPEYWEKAKYYWNNTK